MAVRRLSGLQAINCSGTVDRLPGLAAIVLQIKYMDWLTTGKRQSRHA